jgi:Ser/Thr protein kinase RdoA (MazF antagonist)
MERGALIGQGRTAEIYAWGEGQVIKLYRTEMAQEWAEREARVGRIAAAAGLQVPSIGDTIVVDGRPGILYERVDGLSMLEQLVRRPWQYAALARQFAGLHAAMHRCSSPELLPLRADYGGRVRYAPRLSDAAKEGLLQALDRLPDGDAICHGDFHPDNVILSARGPLVIDWMTALRGDPAADVARTVLIFRVSPLPPGTGIVKRMLAQLLRRAFLSHYLQEYVRLRPLRDEEVEAWMPIVAAARLNERIPGEESALLRLVER